MSKLLSRCRIGCQIATLGLLGVFGVLLIAAINWLGAREVTATADEMRNMADRAGLPAQGAAGVAGPALGNAQTVASAAEQLSASIREFGSQVSQSTHVASKAVEAGTETRSTIEALNERVGRIGAVVDIIGNVAAKANLLALNATIEAARAGNAGLSAFRLTVNGHRALARCLVA